MGVSDGNKCTNCVRYIFFAFNFIFWILGLVVLGVGIYSRIENDTWQDLIDADTFFAAANLLIAAGAIVATLGFFGCLGAIKRWRILLIIYCVLVVMIFVLEIAGGAYAYVKRDVVEEQLSKGIQKAVKMNYAEEDNISAKGFTKVVNWFQEKVECCGVDTPYDWTSSEWYKKKYPGQSNRSQKELHVPDSCCKRQKKNCGHGPNGNGLPQSLGSLQKIIYTKGCVEQGKEYAKNNLYLIGGVGVGIAIVELLAIGFAIGLICAFKKEDEGTTA